MTQLPRFLVIPTLVILFSCNNTPQPAPVMVGNDQDAHGCKGSAGYQWSALKNNCIRLFESGIRLDPQAKELDQTTSAFIVFKSDEEDQQAELFLPNRPGALLMSKVPSSEAGSWTADTFTLNQWKGMYILEGKSGVTLYQGLAAPADASAAIGPNMEGLEKGKLEMKDALRLFHVGNYTVQVQDQEEAGEKIQVTGPDGAVVQNFDKLENAFYLGINNDKVLLDQGTGPDNRRLLIYDLKKGKNTSIVYCGDPSVSPEGVLTLYAAYSLKSGEKAPDCPDKANWVKEGLSVLYGQLTLVDLKSGQVQRKAEIKCFAGQ